MYTLIARYQGSLERLLAEIPRLSPQRGGGGYCCTYHDSSRAIFEPLVKESFPGLWTACFAVVVWPDGHIMPHEQSGEVIEDGSMRYHLVLQTNDKSWNMHNNQWQRLERGGLYEMDPRFVHASINWGAEPRIHLVVDIDGGMHSLGKDMMAIAQAEVFANTVVGVPSHAIQSVVLK